MMLEPSLLKWVCPLSFRTKAISAGMFSGVSSPSFGKVIFVPSFQPFLMTMLRILSSVLMLLPSGFSLRRVIFIRLVQPWKISSRETFNSWTTGGSWCFLLFPGRSDGAPLLLRASPGKPLFIPPGNPNCLPKWVKGSSSSISVSWSGSLLWSPWKGKPLERLWLRLEPKNMSKGLEPPKKEAKVAWGSPWKV